LDEYIEAQGAGCTVSDFSLPERISFSSPEANPDRSLPSGTCAICRRIRAGRLRARERRRWRRRVL